MRNIIKKILTEEFDGFKDFDWTKEIPEPFTTDGSWIIEAGPSKKDQLDAMLFLYSKGFTWGGGYSAEAMSKYDNDYIYRYGKHNINSYGDLNDEIKGMIGSGYKLYKWEDIKIDYNL